MFHDGKGRSLSVEEKVTILNALCASSSPTEVAEGEGEALNDLIRLLEQRYRDMGDTLARKAATALRAAPSLSREEWEMLNAVLDDLADGLIGPSGWATLRAKVREWAKSRP
jgi:hypothetical protein